jgi:PAS domain S-box-containing protein
MTAISTAVGSLRVLLLEDSEADADLIVQTITRAYPSAHFDWAVARKQFTELLAANDYDVVLADYRLPDWTGMEALRELRHLGLDIPLILITGELGDERAVECVKAGAADYLLKTGNLARLPIAVKRAIEEKRARNESRRSQQLIEQAQQQAREQEERFLQLAENIDEVFFVLGARQRETLYINPAYEKIWGRSCQSLYDNPRSFVEPVPAGDRERLMEYMDRVSRGEQAGKLEFRLIQPSGNVRWLLAHAVPIRNERGEVYRIGGVALDITESREAQMALEEIAERLRKLTETSFDAIDITQDGIIQEANPGYLKMFGYERMEEVIGRPLTDFVSDASRADVEMRLAKNIEGTYELEGQRKDGKNFCWKRPRGPT